MRLYRGECMEGGGDMLARETMGYCIVGLGLYCGSGTLTSKFVCLVGGWVGDATCVAF